MTADPHAHDDPLLTAVTALLRTFEAQTRELPNTPEGREQAVQLWDQTRTGLTETLATFPPKDREQVEQLLAPYDRCAQAMASGELDPYYEESAQLQERMRSVPPGDLAQARAVLHEAQQLLDRYAPLIPPGDLEQSRAVLNHLAAMAAEDADA